MHRGALPECARDADYKKDRNRKDRLGGRLGFFADYPVIVRLVMVHQLIETETRLGMISRSFRELLVKLLVLEETQRVFSHLLDVTDVREETVLPVYDDLGNPLDVRRNHRNAAAHRLECGKAE